MAKRDRRAKRSKPETSPGGKAKLRGRPKGTATAGSGGSGPVRAEADGGDGPAAAAESTTAGSLPLLLTLALVLLGVAAYANGLEAPFAFDELSLREAAKQWPPWALLKDSPRPVFEISMAMNYAIGGEAVRGFHVFNIGVHIAAALMLFALVRRTLPLLAHPPGPRPAAWLAFAIAAIWLVHPLQTESVTYVWQRSEA